MKVSRHRNSVDLDNAHFDSKKLLERGWNKRNFEYVEEINRTQRDIAKISSARAAKIKKIEDIESSMLNDIKTTDNQIEDLKNELNKLKETKRRNSTLLEQTVSKHQTGKWIDFRTKPQNKLSATSKQDIIKERTLEIKKALEDERDFSVK